MRRLMLIMPSWRQCYALVISLAAFISTSPRVQATLAVGHYKSVSLSPSGTISQCNPVHVATGKIGVVGHTPSSYSFTWSTNGVTQGGCQVETSGVLGFQRPGAVQRPQLPHGSMAVEKRSVPSGFNPAPPNPLHLSPPRRPLLARNVTK